MNQAEQLLNDLSVSPLSMDNTDLHIVIDSERFMTVPEELLKIGVQNDHNIETVTFDCPRFWNGHDMSKMRVYVNYLRADDEQGADLATNVVVDEFDDTIMHFDWTITGHLTAVSGPIVILVCIQKVADDGTEENHWNSELYTDMYISPGMECEATTIEHYPGIITSLLARMDYVEEIATPETMQNYVNDYLDKNPETPEIIKNYLYTYMSEHYPTTPEAMEEYIGMYLDKHPHLFAIGPTKPPVSCLWFNTGDGSETSDTTVRLTAAKYNDAVYGVVEDTTVVAGRDFEIT